MLKPEEKLAQKRRAFTIELDSGSGLDRVMLPNEARGVLLEGTIGALKHAGFIEDSVLEVTGTRGTLRVDLSREEITKPKG